jgi:hypothetical protein
MRFKDFKKELDVKIDHENQFVMLKYKTYTCPLPQNTAVGSFKRTLQLYTNVFYILMLKTKKEQRIQDDEWLPGFGP